MSLAIAYCRACVGIQAKLVSVEVHLSPGLPRFSLVGLPEVVVKESKERVRSAIINSQFDFPMRRITVNLAPADLPKQGGCFDLAIALCILVATKQLPDDALLGYEFAGELALSGALRSVRGIVAWVSAAQRCHRSLIIPTANQYEADLILSSSVVRPLLPVWPGDSLLSVCQHLVKKKRLPVLSASQVAPVSLEQYPDLSEIKGQSTAKRALIIAAAGRHHLLMSGPPGAGKSMLARCMPGILPPMSVENAQAVAMIYSQHHSGFQVSRWRIRPFRSPQHCASMAALVGGGRPPSPGEISLAHQGVLFLDELPEFSRQALESLREPLEQGSVTISRAGVQVAYPAVFQLLAAMNPCPCGFFGSTDGQSCRCPPQSVLRYRSRLSGPLLDRIDLQLLVSPVSPEALLSTDPQLSGLSSEHARVQVHAAWERQLTRGCCNAALNFDYFSNDTVLGDGVHPLMRKMAEKGKLSARSVVRLLRVARTIADLSAQETISVQHLHEAFAYRMINLASA